MCSTSMTSSNPCLSSRKSSQMRKLRFRQHITCPSQLESHFKPPLPTTPPHCFLQDRMGETSQRSSDTGGCLPTLPSQHALEDIVLCVAVLFRFPGLMAWRASPSAWLGSCLGSFNMSGVEMTGNGRVLVSPDKKPRRLDESERTSCLPSEKPARPLAQCHMGS